MTKKDTTRKEPEDNIFRKPPHRPSAEDEALDERMRAREERRIRAEINQEKARKAAELLRDLRAAIGASSDAEAYIHLFPGDAHRAMRLGKQYLELCVDILAYGFHPEDLKDILKRLHRDMLRVRTEAPRSRLKPIPLPERAPELWSERSDLDPENPAEFIRRVYDVWIGRGLRRRDVSRLDPPLYRAFGVWVHRHPDDDIPELTPNTDDVDAKVAELADLMSPDELRRLGMALQSRYRRAKSSP